MTHGVQILQALRAEMAFLGRKPSDIESAAVIDEYLARNGVKMKRIRKNAPKPRARCAIFDLLAALEGVTDTKQLTRHGGSKIAGAKKQILDVMQAVNPEVTTDQVIAEIRLRWDRWCRKHPDKKVQTVMALVSHWAELGGGPKTKAAAMDIYQIPDGDWLADLCVVMKCTREAAQGREWLDFSPDTRKSILEYRAKKS